MLFRCFILPSTNSTLFTMQFIGLDLRHIFYMFSTVTSHKHLLANQRHSLQVVYLQDKIETSVLFQLMHRGSTTTGIPAESLAFMEKDAPNKNNLRKYCVGKVLQQPCFTFKQREITGRMRFQYRSLEYRCQ